MESLSAECTPLKQRYDGCFNAWFEGYLRPALAVPTFTPVTSTPEPASEKPRLATKWLHSFGSKPLAPTKVEENHQELHVPVVWEPVDTKGKTRAQIKAEEYERNCGQAWREYKSCLTRAIGENPSLSTLLEQARDEHPLPSLNGLENTAWRK